MSQPINLYITYKKVKQRIARAKSPEIRHAAEAATAAAASLIQGPTVSGARAFRAVERKWLVLASSSARPLADEFEHAIRAKCFVVQRPTMNARHAGWSPPRGTVYCLTCAEMPGCVKVGATTLTTTKRAQLLAGRQSLSGIEVPFSLEVEDPSLVEDLAHKSLKAFRVPGPGRSTSNEWFQVSVRAAARAVRAAARSAA
jgi:hypothetical protein